MVTPLLAESIRSKRGKDKFVILGFIYTLNKSNKELNHWVCENRNILVDLAQDLHNTTEFLSLYTVCLVIIENRSIHSCASYINPTDNNLVVKQSSNTQF